MFDSRGLQSHTCTFELPELHREVRQIQIKNARVALAPSTELGLNIWTFWGDGNRCASAHIQVVADGLISAHWRLASWSVDFGRQSVALVRGQGGVHCQNMELRGAAPSLADGICQQHTPLEGGHLGRGRCFVLQMGRQPDVNDWLKIPTGATSSSGL